ncbi:hydroxyphenylacetyl-CoA thioesterase PaaI [Hamadaea sp. NPDC050747]|uniref:hydroxyphenylacetyl-CoA thioesterase PaaI n=1 Tax=Hamadaea sp. NPDC050747 TaxID=3155789 RepID=UPI00340E0482
MSRTEVSELDPACRSLGVELTDLGTGHARLRLAVTGEMLNRQGVVHGGYIFLLADAAFAYAANSHGPVALAQHAQITFLLPAYADDVLEAVAAERARQGRTGVYDCTVRRLGGPVVAEFRGQSVQLPVVPRQSSNQDRGDADGTA